MAVWGACRVDLVVAHEAQVLQPGKAHEGKGDATLEVVRAEGEAGQRLEIGSDLPRHLALERVVIQKQGRELLEISDLRGDARRQPFRAPRELRHPATTGKSDRDVSEHCEY